MELEHQLFAIPEVPHVATEEEYEKRVQQSCGQFEKSMFQHLMQHYLSRRSPRRGLLLYHGLGVGKTCASITIAEALLADHSVRSGPKIWVVLPNALQKSYEDQIVNTNKCMGDKYVNMIYGATARDPDMKRKKLSALVRGRYAMFTYDGFAAEIERLKELKRYKDAISNKVIIVDEAHNLRIQETDKRAAQALMDVATHGSNNRIVLLSATPMYNEPDEIFWLLSVLAANDKKTIPKVSSLYNLRGEPNARAMEVLGNMSSEYVSYIKGRNPFTFAARLSPRDSGVPMFESSDGWEKSIPDGLVPTAASSFQISALARMKRSDATLHQALNICYPTSGGVKVGENGFLSVFRKEVESDPLYVSYINPADKPLFPVPDKLGRIAPKIQRICDLVRVSEGIVVIYSQFVWSGVFPVAVALEHMGFKRHGTGVRNIMKNAEIIDPPARYPGIPFPTYCILSGDTAAMGPSRIEDLLRDINSPRNRHGEVVKVVIMSPVAGEGLSLKNVREVHVLDPWYHMNRLEQVVGRAFRTCEHITLPLQERNVTVFIHVATDPSGETETTDIKSFKIAARKAYQTEETEAVIRDAALDCSLMRHVNYFPKDIFGFETIMRSSRGVPVPYRFGDEPNKAPRCPMLPVNPDASSIRPEVYKELIPTGIVRLKKLFSRGGQLYYTYQDLQDAIAMHPIVVRSVIQEAMHDKKIGLTAHRDRFFVQKGDADYQKKAKRVHFAPSVVTSAVTHANTTDNPVMDIISSQPIGDKDVGKILIYKVLNSQQWPVFAKKILEFGANIPENVATHVRILHEEGAFIGASELPRHRNPSRNPFIGYVDIFDMDNRFKVILYDYDRNMFREATDIEIATIKGNRREVVRPPKETTFAGMEPHKYKKKGDSSPITNEVKLFMPSVTGTQKGIICESLKKNDTLRMLGDIGVSDIQPATKEQVCFTLALEFAKRGKLYFAPSWKPT